MKSLKTQLGEAFKFSEWGELLKLVKANRSVADRFLINFFSRKPEDPAAVWGQLEGVTSRPTPGMTKEETAELLTFLIPIALEYSHPVELPAFMIPGAPLRILEEASKDVSIPGLNLKNVCPKRLPDDIGQLVSSWIFTGTRITKRAWLTYAIVKQHENLAGFLLNKMSAVEKNRKLKKSNPTEVAFLHKAIAAWKKHLDELEEQAPVHVLSTTLDLV